MYLLMTNDGKYIGPNGAVEKLRERAARFRLKSRARKVVERLARRGLRLFIVTAKAESDTPAQQEDLTYGFKEVFDRTAQARTAVREKSLDKKTTRDPDARGRDLADRYSHSQHESRTRFETGLRAGRSVRVFNK